VESIEYAACTLEQDSPTFVAFHHPPHYKEWDIHAMLPESNGGNGDQLLHLLEEASISAAFSGHLHLHDKKTINGIPYIISGCGGARIYKFGFGVTEYGYVLVKVSDYGNDIEYNWVPLRNSPFG
jgi:3',5'-cyclic AMP phosphodiesterase CpdA